jgi:threonine aldolase
MIDLRSDTVTKPTKEMLNAMLNAELGDDVYGEDPTVNELQEYVANLLNKEDAIFVPTGTMSNQLGVKINSKQGDEVIIEKDAHIFFFETAASAIISNVQMRTLPSKLGEMDLNDIENAIRPNIYYFPKTALLCLENTHNRHGGILISLDYIKNVYNIAKRHNINMHLDGARIWNASVATGIPVCEYAKYFDTISVCLSKGLGTPAGSVLVGNKEKITLAKKWRKILGGGMRQTGILAAAGLYALKNNIERLIEDHENTKLLANELNKLAHINININEVQTNMLALTTPENITASELVLKAKEKGLLFNAIDKNKVRIVFHLGITKQNTLKSSEILKDILK